MSDPWTNYPHIWKTKAAFLSFIRGGIRRALWNRSPIKLEFIKKYRKRIKNPNPKGKVKEVWGGTCALCNREFPSQQLNVDHKIGNNSLKELSDLQSFIESIDDGWNSGGHIFLDTITMKDGTVLVISDDVICLYKNQDSFDEGKQCICSMGRPDEDINDMFKTPELIPKEVMKILDKYVPDHDSVSYEVLGKCLKKLEKIGWRFDYGLDAVPFNLRKK